MKDTQKRFSSHLNDYEATVSEARGVFEAMASYIGKKSDDLAGVESELFQ